MFKKAIVLLIAIFCINSSGLSAVVSKKIKKGKYKGKTVIVKTIKSKKSLSKKTVIKCY